jgi:hypothetical protein
MYDIFPVVIPSNQSKTLKPLLNIYFHTIPPTHHRHCIHEAPMDDPSIKSMYYEKLIVSSSLQITKQVIIVCSSL